MMLVSRLKQDKALCNVLLNICQQVLMFGIQ